MDRRIAWLVASTISSVSACGGGGGGGANSPAPDIFQRIAAESVAHSGTYFTHALSEITSPDFGNSKSTSFNCVDRVPISEQSLRDGYTFADDVEVCHAESNGDLGCAIIGQNALRAYRESSNSFVDVLGLRTADSRDAVTFVIAGPQPPQSDFDIIGTFAGEKDSNCDENQVPAMSATDIVGSWSLTVYRMTSHGEPVIVTSDTITCTQSACSGQNGSQLSGVSQLTTSGDGFAYQATALIANASYAGSRAVVSRSKRVMAVLACPNNVDASDVQDDCRFGIAQRL